MKSFFVILFTAAALSSASQSTKLTNADLSGEWYANNRDSAFYKSDTIRFYKTNAIHQLGNSFCYYKVWTFSNGQKITQGGLDNCTEPPVSTMEANPVAFTSGSKKYEVIPVIPNRVILVEKNGGLFLLTYYEKALIDRYRILSKEAMGGLFGEGACVITVARQKKEQPHQ